MSVSRMLALVACIIFALAAFGVSLAAGVAMVPLGLAFLAAAFVV